MNDLRTRHVAAFSRVGRFCLMSAALAAAAAALGSTCVFGSPAYAYADDAALPAGGAPSSALAASPDGDAADAGFDGVSGTADGSVDAAAPGVAEDASSPTGDTPGVDASPAPAPSETSAADASAAPAPGEGSGFPDAAPAAPEGDPSTPGWHDVEGGRIYVMPDGTKASGKAEVDGEIHYFDPETNLEQKGLIDIEGSTYYFDNETGIMRTGWAKPNDRWYYFNADGSAKSGWFKDVEADGAWYCLESTGRSRTGWLEDGGDWYYLRESGRMDTGWSHIDGDWYHLRASGRMDTGWTKVKGDWYHLRVSGRMDTGWIKDGGDWYYLRGSGRMDTGWTKVSGDWYHLRASGRMDTGWIKVKGSWYHLRGSGRMDTGWLEYDGDWYYLYGSGRMATDDTVDGYYLSGSGRWITDSDLIYANSFYSDTNYLIIVDTDSNWVTIYKGAKGFRYEVRSFPCSSGAYSTPTVTGTFEVGEKGYVFGHGNYRCYYYTQFYGDYLFHSVLYRPGGGILDGRLGYHISHGCVRLDIDDAEWIYDNVPSGSTVRVD